MSTILRVRLCCHASENRLGQLAHVPHHTYPTQFAVVTRGFTVENCEMMRIAKETRYTDYDNCLLTQDMSECNPEPHHSHLDNYCSYLSSERI